MFDSLILILFIGTAVKFVVTGTLLDGIICLGAGLVLMFSMKGHR